MNQVERNLLPSLLGISINKLRGFQIFEVITPPNVAAALIYAILYFYKRKYPKVSDLNKKQFFKTNTIF
jgi:hypothetical protein